MNSIPQSITFKLKETSPRRVGAGYESCFSQNLSRILIGRRNDCNGEFPRQIGASYVANEINYKHMKKSIKGFKFQKKHYFRARFGGFLLLVKTLIRESGALSN